MTARRPPDLGAERYVNLETFRRDGRGVRTPVWIVGIGSRLYAFTDGTSAKVRRLRRNPRARLAPCDVRGGIRGDWVDARAHCIADPHLIERVYAELHAKYGWQMWLVDVASRLAGRISRRAVLEIDPQEAPR